MELKINSCKEFLFGRCVLLQINENKEDIPNIVSLYSNKSNSILVIVNSSFNKEIEETIYINENELIQFNNKIVFLKQECISNINSVECYKICTNKLYHAYCCPCKDLQLSYNNQQITLYNEKTKLKYIKKASVGLILNKNNQLLITRRNKHLKTFPHSWVFPGGNVDESESFQNTLIREIKEEVGVDISTEVITTHMIYESSYPINLSDGEPYSHHLIIFYLIKINKDDIKVHVQPEEIDAYSWIDSKSLYEVLKLNNGMIEESNRSINIKAFICNDDTISFNNLINKSDCKYEESSISIDFNKYVSYGHRLAVLKLIDKNYY